MASSTVRLHAGARSMSRAPALSKQVVRYSSRESLQASRISMPCRQTVAKKERLTVQAKVKRKDEGVKLASERLDTLRLPWAAVAAASALVSLGVSDASAFADVQPLTSSPVTSLHATTTNTSLHALSPASLSAPVLVSEAEISRDLEAALGNSELSLTYETVEPFQHAFDSDDFRAKLPNGAGPLGGGEWSFAATRSINRSCPAWGSNPNIEMVVPGAAKALQPHPPRGSRRWFASYPGADTSQLHGGVDEGQSVEIEAGRWEALEVAESSEESAPQKEGEGKNPFEGLIIEIVRMPVFSCFSL